jgi:hypothetical protein
MAWMSVNAFRRRFGFWKSGGGEREPVHYEEFHRVTKSGVELLFEAKKRYVRFYTDPIDSEVGLSHEDVKKVVEAFKKRLGIKVPRKGEGVVQKDPLGRKVYGVVADAYGVKVSVRETGSGNVVLDVENKAIPHLREAEATALISVLARAFKSA